MNSIKLMIVLGIVFISMCSVGNADSFTDWNNTVTNDHSLYPVINNGVSVTFSVVPSSPVTQYYWYVDGTNVSNNASSLAHSWTSPFSKNVTVVATTATDTVVLSWYPTIHRAIGITTSDTINDTAYDDVLESMEDDTDFQGFILASTTPFTAVIGGMFFVIVWGMYFVMSWIRQENIMIPSIVGLILGAVLFVYLPSEFAMAAKTLLLLSASGALYTLYKER